MTETVENSHIVEADDKSPRRDPPDRTTVFPVVLGGEVSVQARGVTHLPVGIRTAPPAPAEGRRGKKSRTRQYRLPGQRKTVISVEQMRGLNVLPVPYPEGVERPRTRGDCKDGPRPCPFAGCRYHLAVDVNPRNGSLVLNCQGVEVEDMTESCALDVADRGQHTQLQVGDILNFTHERGRQIEETALRKLRTSRLREMKEEGT